jgi:hypothetical protein
MTLGDALGPGGRPELYGVRGWLLFLCIVLMVFLPLRVVLFLWVIVASANDPNFLGLGSLLFILAVLSLGAVAGVLLYRERPLGLILAKIFFAIQLAFAAVALIGSLTTRVSTLVEVFASAAWLAYLFRSERVRNTYSNVRAEAVSDVFR